MANLGYIQVTRQCNQRCRFCSNPPNEVLRTLEESCALVDDLRRQGYDGVILTGGEPTLEPSLPELIAYCREVGLPVRMITNGVRLSDAELLDRLIDAGLSHCHLSLHSHLAEVQDELTGNPGGFLEVLEALANLDARRARITVDLNVTIYRDNAEHLDGLIQMAIDRFPFIRHFVFNGLDPDTNRLREAPELIPRLAEFEVSLALAARIIMSTGRTLRVERVPLCYMPGFEHCSTETRKLIKNEERTTHFLDCRGAVRQEAEAFVHRHHEVCEICTLEEICAGLYEREDGYDPAELAPQFIDVEQIRKRVKERR